MRNVATSVCLTAVLVGLRQAAPAAAQAEGRPDARAVVERAIALMGGSALRSIERVRLDMMTQWQRTSYRAVPWSDRPSFEPHVDVRDYTIPAWRNTRDFGAGKITNIVRDSVAVTDIGQGFRPQSVAYVDERDELFVYTPDRLMLLLAGATDLTAAGDTTLGGEPHRRVRATLATPRPLAVTVAFHEGTGLPTALWFRQAHPNDFGLVPFGKMQVEVWYSNWRTTGEVSIPTQWDIERAGAPYKRMTVRNAVFNPTFQADSFMISADLRSAYMASRRPMHDVSVDSVKIAAPGLVQIHGFGFPMGAVRGATGWLLLEAGHAPLSLARGRAALAQQGVSEIAAGLVAAARPGNGGVVDLVKGGVPVYTSAAAAPFIQVILSNEGVAVRGVTVVAEGRWVGEGEERLRLEPIDLPDTAGSLMVYSPRLAWVYAPDAATPLDLRMVRERARALGWKLRAIGTARALWSELPDGA